MNEIIKIENMGYEYSRLKSNSKSLKNLLSDPKSGIYVTKQIFHNLNLSVKKGEVLGILGGNGAGKSTLLKLIAGLYPPKYGRIRTEGTVSPLMELGAGFHPELTAEENIKLNAALIGGKNIDIDSVLDWANLSNEKNNPVRTFSSGMIARLAFSIATSVKSEILLVDEVLSVGDLSFQNKSLNRMHEILKSGETILMVTHNLLLIEQECSRVIVLNNGKIVFDGDPKNAIEYYKTLIF
jgi:ABC-type polysaccharide/polyol phosphate transport system ATPase subunit